MKMIYLLGIGLKSLSALGVFFDFFFGSGCILSDFIRRCRDAGAMLSLDYEIRIDFHWMQMTLTRVNVFTMLYIADAGGLNDVFWQQISTIDWDNRLKANQNVLFLCILEGMYVPVVTFDL